MFHQLLKAIQGGNEFQRHRLLLIIRTATQELHASQVVQAKVIFQQV